MEIPEDTYPKPRQLTKAGSIGSLSSLQLDFVTISTLSFKSITRVNQAKCCKAHAGFLLCLFLRQHTVRSSQVDSQMDSFCRSYYSYLVQFSIVPTTMEMMVKILIEIDENCFLYKLLHSQPPPSDGCTVNLFNKQGGMTCWTFIRIHDITA